MGQCTSTQTQWRTPFVYIVDKLWYVNNERFKFVLLNTAGVMTRLLNVDRKTPVRSGRQRKTGAERTSQWTSSSTWESPASYPVTSRVFAAKRETPLTRETRTLRCGPHSRVSADNIEQCFSTAGPRPGTGPWHQLYRAARGLRKLQYATRFH